MINICRHCQLPFETKQFVHERKYCYKPECIAKEKERIKEKQRKYIKLYKENYEKPKPRNKMCSCCHVNPVMKNNRFLCEKCFTESGDIIELYCGWGADLRTSMKET